ncbi:MAG: TonB-dependent receptor [Methylococcales bacterium]|nr:TonB-dependent receptor [Methylococcales bacterium]
MNNRSLSYLLLLFLCITATALSAETNSAIVNVYVFEDGRPLTGVEVNIAERFRQSTDSDGHVFLTLPPGEHPLQLLLAKQAPISLNLRLTANENIQIIVSTQVTGGEPKIDIETSNPAGFNQAVPVQEASQKIDGKGFLSGKVYSSEDKKPIAGAQVFISGLASELRTDKNGVFKVEVPVGEYNISVLHSDFSTQIKEKVPVIADSTTDQPFAMTPAGLELPEYVVIEPHIAGSLASVVDEQRNTSQVANILGAEQVTRNGDTDAASALRRASGLTLVGGKFIFIRGLGERYSTTLLNGISIPSPDPTRRVVPLDLFPTSVLDTLLIQKSYSVDRQAEFAGGTVDLRTKSIPDDFFFDFDFRTGFQDGTTASQGLRYNGGRLDFLGADDGTRALPESMDKALAGGTQINRQNFNQEEINQFGRDLSGTYDIDKASLRPDFRVNSSIGDKFHMGDFTFGFTGSLRWADSWDSQQEKLKEFAVNRDSLDLIIDNVMDRTERETQTSGYWGMELAYKDYHKLFGRALILRQTFDEARITEGFTESEATIVRRSRLRYIENRLIVGQWGGEHMLNRLGDMNLLDGIDWLGDIKLNWQLSRANSGRESPNEREYRFDLIRDEFEFSRRADSNSHIFSELNDEDMTYRLDMEIPVNLHENIKTVLSSGFMQRTLERDSAIRRFSFTAAGPNVRGRDLLTQRSLESIIRDDLIDNRGFILQETTRATDNYTASQDLMAYYGMGDITLFDSVRLTGGVRIEDNDQQVTTFELFNPNNQPTIAALKQTDVLPSAAATWMISDHEQFRFSWSETLSRPDLRELSPAPFTDPNNDRETLGNPDLQQSEITSFDARWEYYFSPTEFFTVGWFKKELTNPIETVQLPGPAGLLTLQNAATATLDGTEVEINKHFDFIDQSLEDFYFSANYTFSLSEIELLPENLQTQTTNFRPLQGHSKHIINASMGYANPDNGITATLLYNRASKRITEVGVLGAPDKLERPFDQVDFVLRYQALDYLSINFNARNLLDPEQVVTQGNRTTRAFKRGRDFRLGFKLSF